MDSDFRRSTNNSSIPNQQRSSTNQEIDSSLDSNIEESSSVSSESSGNSQQDESNQIQDIDGDESDGNIDELELNEIPNGCDSIIGDLVSIKPHKSVVDEQKKRLEGAIDLEEFLQRNWKKF